MPLKSLSDEPPAQTDVYIDTSGLLAIGIFRAGQDGDAAMRARTIEAARSQKVLDFASRLAAQGGTVKMTMLVIEEAVAMIRRVFREQLLVGQTWRDYARANPTQVQAVHNKTLRFLDVMVDYALRNDIQLDRPPVKPNATQTAATSQRKRHREIFKKHPQLDPMDALHIAVAAEMKIRTFISFDRAWANVAEIDVYGD